MYRRCLSGIDEGLSFSDHLDDSIPYEQKPPQMLAPMEEGGMKPEQKEEFTSHLTKLFAYQKGKLKLKTTPKVTLSSDQTNANKILGKTGYYNPDKKEIVLFISGRHPKDILRSFAHEVIHHWQHENKQLESHKSGESDPHDPQYAQHDPWMRQMEKQAYLLGNIMFRDWEDGEKAQDRKAGKKLA